MKITDIAAKTLPVDLHVHSTRSDGTFTPSQLVDYAIDKGLAAFALTDHDTVDGLAEAFAYAESLRLKQNAPPVPEVIPGIEFSTEYHGRDVHILGLYIDHQDKAFTHKIQEFVDTRILRNRKMCRLLREAGIDVTYEALLEAFPDSVITRAHYAKYMLSQGYIQSMKEAFDRYIGDDCPCYVPREKVTPVQAVKLVLEAGGVPILAHPILYRLTAPQLEELTLELKAAGLVGVEAVYSTYNAAEERQIRALAARQGLLVSGGSDFHGSNKPGLDLAVGYGNLFIPYSVLADIKKAAGR